MEKLRGFYLMLMQKSQVCFLVLTLCSGFSGSPPDLGDTVAVIPTEGQKDGERGGASGPSLIWAQMLFKQSHLDEKAAHASSPAAAERQTCIIYAADGSD